jgi:hypothetical protein
MGKYVIFGNPVMSSAETLAPIKEYDALEDAEREINEARLAVGERINGCYYTFKAGTPYREFNCLYYEGILKEHCWGEAPGSGWESHGSRCACGEHPDKYTFTASPRVLIRRESLTA